MVDTHCHLIDPQFKKDLNAVLRRAREAGIKKIINAGYDLKTTHEAVELNKKENCILPAAGIHPNETAEESFEDMIEIEKVVSETKIYAIGETGLDYYRNFAPRDAQKRLFRRHIVLAKKHNLPLLIHTRSSIDDTIKILQEEDYHKGVFHCYSGTYRQAKLILNMGFYLSFGGPLTFSKHPREVFKNLPLDRILLETDAPYLAPQGHRGERNEPSFIIETLNTATQILSMQSNKLEKILDQNATTLFAL